jgi:sec-independent protein translocase protein TatB
MFDFGFSKLLILGIVALVVIGPERLPRVARTLGHLYGRLQRYVTQVKADIHREMEAADLGKVKTEFEDAARSFQSEVESKLNEADRDIREMQTAIESVDGASPPRDREIAGLPPADAPPAPETPANDPPASPQLELGIEEPPSKESPPRRAAG